VGMTPASESLSALTITITRIANISFYFGFLGWAPEIARRS
jgi:hypothetical protein